MAANTVPTPAKNEVMLKAICVLHLSKATRSESRRFRRYRSFLRVYVNLEGNEEGLRWLKHRTLEMIRP
jgi:hypothetical protein